MEAPGTKAPGAISSLRERGLFNDRSDLVRVDDEGGMAAGDLRRLRLDPGGEHLLDLGCEHLVPGADHIERRFVVPRCGIDRRLERRVVQRKLGVSQGFGGLQRQVSRATAEGNTLGSM